MSIASTRRAKQGGFSFLGFLFVGGLVAFILIIGMKLFPAYLEYSNVKKAIHSIKGMNEKEARKSFYNRTTIDDITAVTPADLDITKEGISVEWHKTVPLIGNVSACIAFKASTIEDSSQ